MASISQIRELSELIPDDELRQVTLQIIAKVAERLARENQGLWTVGVISDWVRRESSDPALLKSLQLLVSRRDAQLLDVHYIYVDPHEGAADGELLEDDEVAAAYSTGYLVDPATGRRITNFESSLHPYFVPAEGLTAA